MSIAGAARPPAAAGSAEPGEPSERRPAEQAAAEEGPQARARPERPRGGLSWAPLINGILQQTVPAAIQYAVQVMTLRRAQVTTRPSVETLARRWVCTVGTGVDP